jgi:hypothetical protein
MECSLEIRRRKEGQQRIGFSKCYTGRDEGRYDYRYCFPTERYAALLVTKELTRLAPSAVHEDENPLFLVRIRAGARLKVTAGRMPRGTSWTKVFWS